MTTTTDACQFGCGPVNDDSTVGGPGFALIPACPVHGWVCELLDQSAARLTAAETEREAARKAWSIESREHSSLLARLTTAEQERRKAQANVSEYVRAARFEQVRANHAEARVEAALTVLDQYPDTTLRGRGDYWAENFGRLRDAARAALACPPPEEEK